MKSTRKYLSILLALTLCVMTGCSKSGEEEPLEEMPIVPNAYFVGSESITAVQPEVGMRLSQLTTTETGAFVYTYVGFESVGESVQAYVAMLTGEEHGFKVVDGETYRAANQPDFTTGGGTVCLSKEAENEKITVVKLNWSADQCVASISIEDAPVIETPKPKPQMTGLSHSSAIEFLKGLSPAVLELDGESMEDYNIYIMNGFCYVDGKACLRVKIYTDVNISHTNVFMGTYFLSGDGENIYKLSGEGLAIEMNQNR